MVCGRALEGMAHNAALGASWRMLHLIDNQHHIGSCLVNELREGMTEPHPTRLSERFQLEAELEAGCADINAGYPLQFLQNAGAGSLQLLQTSSNGVVYQVCGVCLRLTPLVYVDDYGARLLKRGDEICRKKGRLPNSSLSQKEQAGPIMKTG